MSIENDEPLNMTEQEASKKKAETVYETSPSYEVLTDTLERVVEAYAEGNEEKANILFGQIFNEGDLEEHLRREFSSVPNQERAAQRMERRRGVFLFVAKLCRQALVNKSKKAVLELAPVIHAAMQEAYYGLDRLDYGNKKGM